MAATLTRYTSRETTQATVGPPAERYGTHLARIPMPRTLWIRLSMAAKAEMSSASAIVRRLVVAELARRERLAATGGDLLVDFPVRPRRRRAIRTGAT